MFTIVYDCTCMCKQLVYGSYGAANSLQFQWIHCYMMNYTGTCMNLGMYTQMCNLGIQCNGRLKSTPTLWIPYTTSLHSKTVWLLVTTCKKPKDAYTILIKQCFFKTLFTLCIVGMRIPAHNFVWAIYTYLHMSLIEQPIHLNELPYVHLSHKRSFCTFFGIQALCNFTQLLSASAKQQSQQNELHLGCL